MSDDISLQSPDVNGSPTQTGDLAQKIQVRIRSW
jgi:hypothetical protein